MDSPPVLDDYEFGEGEMGDENRIPLWPSLPQSASRQSESPSRPPSTSELDRLLFHVPLADFGLRLQRAAEAVFPNTSSCRYRQVHVLLIEWDEGDPCLPVHQELEELRAVFEDCYRFQTEIWRIPCKAAHRALNRKITDFVELEDDGKDCLKIVYYGGHGFLSPSRQLMWSNLPSNDPRHQSVKWYAIQATLEDAESDVLLLLDCCAAGTASTDHGNGVTELIGACAFNVNANGVGEFSFTTALSKELRAFSKIPSFTVGRLYNNLLRRTQMTLSHMTLQKAPVHVVLTQDHKLPRSIQLSPLPPRFHGPESGLIMAQAEVETRSSTSENSPSSKSSDNDPFSLRSSRTSMSSLSLEPPAKLYPRIALSVQLPDNVRPDQLSEDLFRDWLRMIPVIAENVKVEAGWASFSSLVIVSVPMLIWRYIEEHPAVRMVGIIRSPNVISPKPQPVHDSATVPDVEMVLKHNFRNGLRTVKNWFAELSKRKQREVLFKLHDVRASGKFIQQSTRYTVEAPSVTESDYWTSEMDSADEKEQDGSRVGRRRHRSRTRSSDQYADSEAAVVHFHESPVRPRREMAISSNDSAYGSVTSGSRPRKSRRDSSASSIGSFDENMKHRSEQSRDYKLHDTLASRVRTSTEDASQSLGGSEVSNENFNVEYGSTCAPVNIASFYSALHGYPAPPSPPASRMNSFDPLASISQYQSPSATNAASNSSPFPSPAHFSSPSPIMPSLITSGPSTNRSGRTDFAGNKVRNREELTSPKEQQKVQFHFSVTGEDHELPPPSPNIEPPMDESIISERVSASPQPYDHFGDISTRESWRLSPEVSDGFLLSQIRSEMVDPEKTDDAEEGCRSNSMHLKDSQITCRVVSPPRGPVEEKAVKGILRQPRDKFPEDPVPIREGVAALKDARNDSIPPMARWTRISRKLVNPKALEEGKERFEVKDDYVVVLRVLSREEVQGYASATAQIRADRKQEKNQQSRVERRKARYERYRQRKQGVSLQGENHPVCSSEGETQSDATSRDDTT
ncbi:hypothetical protein PVAG01_02008 [Phlyctema vagabunda]|uniref:DUF8035 domain-containing protein n=1 Tax=Phlyctema vagabunda TaxID=108571 RepID=A0ABR4PYY8_9HELO